MRKRCLFWVALLIAGCGSQDQKIDAAIEKMKAEIMDGTQVDVDRSTATLHYREKWYAVCGAAQVSNPNPIFRINGGQEHFVIFAHDSGAVTFSLDDSREPDGREEFKRVWNANCVD